MKRKMASRIDALAAANAVCVVLRREEAVSVMCYNDGAEIRTYLPDEVDGRWSGPLLATASEVLTHLGHSEEPCSVPVKLAQRLFNWTIPFADLPAAEVKSDGDDPLHPSALCLACGGGRVTVSGKCCDCGEEQSFQI